MSGEERLTRSIKIKDKAMLGRIDDLFARSDAPSVSAMIREAIGIGLEKLGSDASATRAPAVREMRAPGAIPRKSDAESAAFERSAPASRFVDENADAERSAPERRFVGENADAERSAPARRFVDENADAERLSSVRNAVAAPRYFDAKVKAVGGSARDFDMTARDIDEERALAVRPPFARNSAAAPRYFDAKVRAAGGSGREPDERGGAFEKSSHARDAGPGPTREGSRGSHRPADDEPFGEYGKYIREIATKEAYTVEQFNRIIDLLIQTNANLSILRGACCSLFNARQNDLDGLATDPDGFRNGIYRDAPPFMRDYVNREMRKMKGRLDNA